MLVLLASLTACTVAKQPAIELDPALLSASEAGGNQTALTPDAWMSAAKCGPDIEDAYGGGWDPEATARSNVVRFADDRESTVLGLWDVQEQPNEDVAATMRLQNGLLCSDEIKLRWVHKHKLTQNWRITELKNFDDKEIYAFQAVKWYLKYSVIDPDSTLPDKPVPSESVAVTSTARAYGRICDTVVMVRINNTTPTPPTEVALKELWDKQVNKLIQVRYPNYPEGC